MKIEDVRLSSSVRVADYLKLKKCKDREAIADFIRERFTERYITPLRWPNTHGFSIMAVSCLMIEALESFWQGWPATGGKGKKGKSEKAFKCFFQRCKKQGAPLGVFAEIAEGFYESVRCGILHQAETTNGWLIRKSGCLYNPKQKSINATKFHNELECALRIYCEVLKASDWDDKLWCKLRNKMKQVIDNCKLPPPQA